MIKRLTFDEYLTNELQDPAFRAEWEALQPAHQLKRLRILKKLSQTELAAKVGTRQPSIARLESGYGVNNLKFLRRVAEALDAEVEIRVTPKIETVSKPARYAKAKGGQKKSA